LCLVRLAQRRSFAFATESTISETRETTIRLIRELQPKHNAAARLAWYLDRTRLVEPAPLGKTRSRDPADDPYLAAALGAKAEAIVTCDKDLLSLQKPFGIAILKPVQFLKQT
jgi:predicted nucleic acid-binding protein